MGTYSRFKLEIEGDTTLEQVAKWLEDNTWFFGSGDTELTLQILKGEYPERWYDREKDMKNLSLDFPDSTFTLEVDTLPEYGGHHVIVFKDYKIVKRGKVEIKVNQEIKWN